jgi:ribonuclease Z
MAIEITLLGTGSPLPDPLRAGPSTLVQAGQVNLLVDAGRGVLMRLAAAGLGPSQITAVLLTHLHSDHLTDLNDVITTRWITSFPATPLIVLGPPGTANVVDHLMSMLRADISYRIHHHDDLTDPPVVHVTECVAGMTFEFEDVTVTVGETDHKPVEPSIGFRVDHEGVGVVLAGDTVPCEGLDILCTGADALVHTAIRSDIVAMIPMHRLQDILDYHSSVEQAAQTAQRAGVGTLVLTHYVPAFGAGEGQDWRDLAATEFGGRIELGDDLHRVTVTSDA